MKTALVYIYKNDNLLELQRLTNSLNKQPITDATVTFTLFDTTGATVLLTGAMTYDAQSGMYTAVLPYDLNLVLNKSYPIEVIADAGAGKHGRWAATAKVQE